MSAYRTPDGRDPGRLIRDLGPSDSGRVPAAIVLTASALLGMYSLVRPPRSPGHFKMLVAAGFLSLVMIVQLLLPKQPRVRIFEEGVAVTGREDRFVPWSSVAEFIVKRTTGGRRHRFEIDTVTLRLKNGTSVEITLAFDDNEPVLAELRERTRPYLEP